MKTSNKFKVAVLICTLFAMVVGCAGDKDVVIKATAEMVAEEIGYAVAQANPDLLPKVEAYYDTMQAYYNGEEFDLLSIAMEDGIKIILEKYVGDAQTSARIASKVKRLMALSGFEPSLVVPGADKLRELAPEYIMSVTDAFIGGMKMAAL